MTQSHGVFQVCAHWVLNAGQTTDLPLDRRPPILAARRSHPDSRTEERCSPTSGSPKPSPQVTPSRPGLSSGFSGRDHEVATGGGFGKGISWAEILEV